MLYWSSGRYRAVELKTCVVKRFFKIFGVILLIFTVVLFSYFYGYANSLRGIHPDTLTYYDQLKSRLILEGFRPRTLVISSKRADWHNRLLTAFGAAKNSQHLHGKALDIVVLDVNGDGFSDSADVYIVVEILEELVGHNGGIGTYTNEKFLWNRQMVHFDCRGHHARWNR